MSRGLFHAVLRGDAEGVADALREGAEPDARRGYWGFVRWAADRRSPVPGFAWNDSHFDGLLDRPATGDERFDRTRTPLLFATELGRYDAAVLLLEAGADPNFAEEDGGTPLLAAMRRENERLVSLLLARGARTDGTIAAGETPLYRAAKAGRPGIVRRLLAAGADPDAATVEGLTPLMVAAAHGDIPRFLYVRFTPFDATEVGERRADAPAPDYAATVALLLEAGADPDWVVCEEPLRIERTALAYAISAGDLASVRLLLDAGADISDEEEGQGTLLRTAVEQGNVDIFHALYERGADPFHVPPDGETLLMRAASKGHPDVMRWLLDRGVPLEARRSRSGATALHAAVGADKPESVWLLLERGADPDAPDHGGVTPLMAAARYGRLACARALLRGGASLGAQDAEGRTALDHARATDGTASARTGRSAVAHLLRTVMLAFLWTVLDVRLAATSEGGNA